MKGWAFLTVILFFGITARLYAEDTYGTTFSPAASYDDKEKEAGCQIAWALGSGRLTYNKLTPEQRLALNLLKTKWPQEYEQCYGNVSSGRAEENNRSSSRQPLYEATVIQVLDADSVMFSTGEKAELIGFKIPEGEDGSEAAEFLKELVQNKKVRIQYDAQKQDRFGRMLAYLFREEDNLFVNSAMIETGLVEPDIVPPNVMYRDRFLGEKEEPADERVFVDEEERYLVQMQQRQLRTLLSVCGVFVFSFLLMAGFRIWDWKRRNR